MDLSTVKTRYLSSLLGPDDRPYRGTRDGIDAAPGTEAAVRTIAVEEHFRTASYERHLLGRSGYPRREELPSDGGPRMVRDHVGPELSVDFPADLSFGLLDEVDERLREMDAAGVDVQVLSMGYPSIEDFAPAEAVEWARSINDEAAATCAGHPDRFVALAKLPWQAPDQAVAELRRCVTVLGMRGVKVDSHVGGQYLDGPEFRPVFREAAELGVPIYLHPREPRPDMLAPFLAYPGLPLALWGFPSDVSLHTIRLICSGLFDEFPDLTVVLGHLGEGIPMFLDRMDRKGLMPSTSHYLKLRFSEYVRRNIMVATSGMFTPRELRYVVDTLGADRVMFAADYPFEPLVEATAFLAAAPLTEHERAAISHGNAERVFAL